MFRLSVYPSYPYPSRRRNARALAGGLVALAFFSTNLQILLASDFPRGMRANTSTGMIPGDQQMHVPVRRVDLSRAMTVRVIPHVLTPTESEVQEAQGGLGSFSGHWPDREVALSLAGKRVAQLELKDLKVDGVKVIGFDVGDHRHCCCSSHGVGLDSRARSPTWLVRCW